MVRIRLKSGSEYENFVSLPKEKFTDDELGEKFIEMVEPVIGAPEAKELKKKIDNLESLSDVRQLFSC